MGCSSDIEAQQNQDSQIPLKIDGKGITSIIFKFEGGDKIPIIALPFFRLGNLFLQSLLKNKKTELYNNINSYKFNYKANDISLHFYRNDEVKILGIKTQSIEIRVSEVHS